MNLGTSNRSTRLSSALAAAALAALLSGPAARAQVADTTLWCPNSTVSGVTVDRSRVYAWGTFNGFRDTPRGRLVSLDKATGRLTNWDPGPDGSISSVVVGQGRIYVGGHFTHIAGTARNNIAAFDSTTGNLLNWYAGAIGSVRSMVLVGNVLYISEDMITAVNATTGVYKWSVDAGMVDDMVYAQNRLILGGSFWSVDGYPRNGMAMLDAASGWLYPWAPEPDNFVRAIAVNGNTVYVGGAFTELGHYHRSSRYHIAALDMATGDCTDWDPGAGGTVTELAVADGILYAAGGFTTIDGADRRYLAALYESDATASSWDPNPESEINSLVLDGSTLYVGGQFHGICGMALDFLARMPDSPSPTLLARFDAEVGAEGVTLRWGFNAAVRAVTVERAGSSSGPWSALAVEIAQRPGGSEALDRTAEPGTEYWYRLVATMGDGARAEFGPVQAYVPATLATSGIVRLGPNPTSGQARIDYQVERPQPVRLSVLDVTGREVAVLFEGAAARGRHSASWDGRSARGALAAGVYFVRLRAGGRTSERRLVLMR